MRRSLDAHTPLILSALMPDGHFAWPFARGFKSNLGIGDLHKEVVLAFGKHFEPLSVQQLSDQVVAFARHRHDIGRRKLVAPRVAIQNFWAKRDFFMRLGDVEVDRNAFVEQMQADVIDADGSLGVGQRHHAYARFGIEADEASVSTDTAIFPDYWPSNP
jgi:hypothetical protein